MMCTQNVGLNNQKIALKAEQVLASGGEAVVYQQGQTVFKLYHDPKSARSQNKAQKIQKLKSMQLIGCALPQDILVDEQGDFVGFTMPKIKGVSFLHAISALHQQQMGWGVEDRKRIIQKIQKIYQRAHQEGVVLADANEMNWMIDGQEPWLLDVDSCQFPGFPALVMMPSIKDPKSKSVSVQTDWFAFSVLAFEMFTGLHPYKGGHPDFAKNQWVQRQEAGVSALDPKATLPPSARSLQEIPKGILGWLQEVLSHKTRTAPPKDWDSANANTIKVSLNVQKALVSAWVEKPIMSGFRYLVQKISEDSAILEDLNGERHWVHLESKKVIQKWSHEHQQKLAEKVLCPVQVGNFNGLRYCLGNSVYLEDPNGQRLADLNISAQKVLRIGERYFALNDQSANGLQELMLIQTQMGWKLGVKALWPLLTQSTKWFDKVGVQQALGGVFLITVGQNEGVQINPAPFDRTISLPLQGEDISLGGSAPGCSASEPR